MITLCVAWHECPHCVSTAYGERSNKGIGQSSSSAVMNLCLPLTNPVPLRIKKRLHLLFSDTVKNKKKTHTLHTSCTISLSHTHTHTHTHIDTSYPPETQRPLGSLPFTQKPLWKVTQSNTNTFSLVSEDAHHFEKRLSQSLQRSNALDGD